MAQLWYQLWQPDIVTYVKRVVWKFFARKIDGVLVNIDSTVEVIGKVLLDEEQDIRAAAAKFKYSGVVAVYIAHHFF